jgi:hypothetical protein
MELLIIVLALCVLGLLAISFGHDSRGGLRSHEEDYAANGMTWDSSLLR